MKSTSASTSTNAKPLSIAVVARVPLPRAVGVVKLQQTIVGYVRESLELTLS